ncbi:hypothetical protein WA026_023273, partial [Henosepilachna vigintioctopunctata]
SIPIINISKDSQFSIRTAPVSSFVSAHPLSINSHKRHDAKIVVLLVPPAYINRGTLMNMHSGPVRNVSLKVVRISELEVVIDTDFRYVNPNAISNQERGESTT